MATYRRLLLAVIVLGTFALSFALPRRASAQDHRFWAADLVSKISASNNSYASPSAVTWAGVGGAAVYSNQSTCAGFVTRSLQQAYGWDDLTMMAWLGSASPYAVNYHDAIVAESGFERVLYLDEIRPGDIIAISYPAGSDVTGHVAIAQSAPSARAAKQPLVSGTFQFGIRILDSSTSGHGSTDTRLQADGTYHEGAGSGVMRLYADEDLNIVGYTWSTYSSSTYRDVSTHSLVVGRLL